MGNKVIGKIMVLSIIAVGLLQFIQNVFIGHSTMLFNIKLILLVIALFSALIMVSIMSWKMKKQRKLIGHDK